MPRLHRSFILLTVGILAFAWGAWAICSFAIERGRFERGLGRVCTTPDQCVGQCFGVNTTDCVGVSSQYIGETVDVAYRDLSRSLGWPPKTYYSECVDMPTQETIWQFQGYFVRLYVTSSLDCDAAEIGVFSGTYESFRGEALTPRVGPQEQFLPIEYVSPCRFLYSDR